MSYQPQEATFKVHGIVNKLGAIKNKEGKEFGKTVTVGVIGSFIECVVKPEDWARIQPGDLATITGGISVRNYRAGFDATLVELFDAQTGKPIVRKPS